MIRLTLALLLLPAAAMADERLDAARAFMTACFEAAETHEAELGCLGKSVIACTPEVENPGNPDLLPCVEAEATVWRERGDGRLASLEEIIRAAEGTDDPCTPTAEACIGQVREMDLRMRTQGELACEQAAQLAALDGVPDLGRAACMMRELALRAVRLAELRKDQE